jgi:hypothetical protein
MIIFIELVKWILLQFLPFSYFVCPRLGVSLRSLFRSEYKIDEASRGKCLLFIVRDSKVVDSAKLKIESMGKLVESFEIELRR